MQMRKDMKKLMMMLVKIILRKLVDVSRRLTTYSVVCRIKAPS